ncbi:RND transporter, Hydrophobe/Amphiphile Efflux-1 (HAE1)/Heavy Metal Efflux (HME) family, permease protein [Leptospira ryugenii]|uniref:RND transporter, Hydrophobe/Amphiphile Efflux-1 (HAE1)/Heavy Metal Efflux (HME) family, permease protein n=2 Tax=Leptospira ryugenii TaxID=1917863 RepID=A0A2P2E0M8_9LEPT|nr:RND transporter, Hydrophobe/Amphiphile Efflux-1 (HAE1)/Heavy Metal Efflux (HME) family, permease protein [Leptospira ryugenii]
MTVLTRFENASPKEMETLVSKPILQALGSLPGVSLLEAESREGLSIVQLTWKRDVDLTYALLDTREKLDMIRDLLPTDAEKPLITRFDPNSLPFLEIVFFSKSLLDPKSLRQFVEEQIKLYFERVEGVAWVQISGGYEKEIKIELDPHKSDAYKINPKELIQIISAHNQNIPAGSLPFGKKELPIRTMGQFQSIHDLGNLLIGAKGASNGIRLSEVAEISESYKERTSSTQWNGEEAVLVSLYREPGKNSIEISENIQKVLKQIQENFGTQIQSDLVYDESIYIQDSIKGLYLNLVIGCLLAFFALLLILKNFQSPSILLLTIPFTLLPSFCLFHTFQIGFNMMSLGGLTLAIGMLFDASNVVLSGIERNFKIEANLEIAIANGMSEVYKSVSSATLTSIIVFLPLVFIKGTIGLVFREMAYAIVISLSVSLLVSLFLIPILTLSLFSDRREEKSHFLLWNLYQREVWIDRYLKAIVYVKNRFTVFTIAVFFFFILSLFFFPWLDKEYLPELKSKEISIQINLPKGTSYAELMAEASLWQDEFLHWKDVKSILSLVGQTNSLSTLATSYEKENSIELKLSFYDQITDAMKKKIHSIADRLKKTNGIQIKPSENQLSRMVRKETQINHWIYVSPEGTSENRWLTRLKEELLRLDPQILVKRYGESKSEEIHLRYDPLKLVQLGFSQETVSSQIQMALKGYPVTNLESSSRQTPIRLGFKKESLSDLQHLLMLRIPNSFGEYIALSQILTMKQVKAEESLFRRGNQSIQILQIHTPNTAKTNQESLEHTFQSIADQMAIQTFMKEIQSDRKESFLEILISFGFAFVFVYMMLAGNFESYRIPIVMLLSFPLIFIGVFPALFFSGKTLNISSFMGIILLLGVVVDNASLYYEYFHLFQLQGMESFQAMLEACSSVFQPILMNNASTILGMFPILFSLGTGGEFQAPLGIVVVSGLLTSVILSLFLIPLIFYFLEKN